LRHGCRRVAAQAAIRVSIAGLAVLRNVRAIKVPMISAVAWASQRLAEAIFMG
jgi:hypothetical protein